MTPSPLPSLTSPRTTNPRIPGPTATAASLDTPPDRPPAPEAAPYFSLPLFLGRASWSPSAPTHILPLLNLRGKVTRPRSRHQGSWQSPSLRCRWWLGEGRPVDPPPVLPRLCGRFGCSGGPARVPPRRGLNQRGSRWVPDPDCLAGLRKWGNSCSCLCPVLACPLGGGRGQGCRLTRELELLIHRKGSEAGGARASEVGSRQLFGVG